MKNKLFASLATVAVAFSTLAPLVQQMQRLDSRFRILSVPACVVCSRGYLAI